MANNEGVKSKRSSGTVHTPRGINQGIVLIDSNSGFPVSVIEDAFGNKRIAVDAALTISNVIVEVDINAASGDNIQIRDPNTGNNLKVESDGSINTNTEVDAADGDNISINDSITGDSAKVNASRELQVKDDDVETALITLLAQLSKLPDSYTTVLTSVTTSEKIITSVAGQQKATISVIGTGKIFYSYQTGVSSSNNFLTKGDQVEVNGENSIFFIKTSGSSSIQIDREIRT